MFVRLGLIVVGFVHLVNGATMIAAPAFWYEAVPGVVTTGPMNLHFIRDIGLIFAASGMGLAQGARAGFTAPVLALAGATWPALHGLFHIWLWFSHGFPQETMPAISDVFGVVGLSALGLWLAYLRAR